MKTFKVKLNTSGVLFEIEVKANGYDFEETSITGTLLLKFYKYKEKVNVFSKNDLKDEIMTIIASNVVYVVLIKNE